MLRRSCAFRAGLKHPSRRYSVLTVASAKLSPSRAPTVATAITLAFHSQDPGTRERGRGKGKGENKTGDSWDAGGTRSQGNTHCTKQKEIEDGDTSPNI